MITFHYETDFLLDNESHYINWVTSIIISENKEVGEIAFIFCDDIYLHNLNLEHLKHDTLTDIISFDYSLGNEISGDVFISIERVLDNATDFNTVFLDELNRVMSHGILHYCGYKDKTDSDIITMRIKENEKLNLFHVKQT